MSTDDLIPARCWADYVEPIAKRSKRDPSGLMHECELPSGHDGPHRCADPCAFEWGR